MSDIKLDGRTSLIQKQEEVKESENFLFYSDQKPELNIRKQVSFDFERQKRYSNPWQV